MNLKLNARNAGISTHFPTLWELAEQRISPEALDESRRAVVPQRVHRLREAHAATQPLPLHLAGAVTLTVTHQPLQVRVRAPPNQAIGERGGLARQPRPATAVDGGRRAHHHQPPAADPHELPPSAESRGRREEVRHRQRAAIRDGR